MLRIALPILALAFATLAAPAVGAGSAGVPRHGLALYGDLKYQPGFTHYDYADPEAPKGGSLSLSAEGTFDNLNPFILKGVAAAGASELFESLLESSADEPDSAYGLIAESVTLAPDRTSVAFTLRAEARWHDGSPITAEDVVFSLDTLKTKGHPSFRILYADVTGAEALSEREVVFRLRASENRKLPLLVATMPVISRAYYSANEFDRTTLKPPLGSGPYRVDKVDPGRAISYRRDPAYWGAHLPIKAGRHNFDLIRYDYYRDRTVMVEALKAGAYEYHEEFTSKTWSTAYDIAAVEQGWMVKEVLPDNTPSGVQAFFINTRRAKFQDPRVRLALSYAFDFEWTNKNIFYGLYDRMASYFENSELAARGLPTAAELALLEPYRDELPEAVFAEAFEPPRADGGIRGNLRRARRLLNEAGWVVRDGALVQSESGEPFSIEFLYFMRTFERVIGPYVRNLERLGIETTMRLVDVPQYQRRLEEFDFDLTTQRYVQFLSPSSELRDYFGSAYADQIGSRNLAGIGDPVVDALIETVLAAPDRERMTTAVRALDRVLLWGYYMVPQWYKGEHHLIYWNKFGRPASQPKYAIGLDTWWVDRRKHADLTTYRKSLD